jgi:hypothetical protein
MVYIELEPFKLAKALTPQKSMRMKNTSLR